MLSENGAHLQVPMSLLGLVYRCLPVPVSVLDLVHRCLCQCWALSTGACVSVGQCLPVAVSVLGLVDRCLCQCWALFTGACVSVGPCRPVAVSVLGLVCRWLWSASGRMYRWLCQYRAHTPSIAFRHLPPNLAGFSYATEGTLYLRAAVQRRGQSPPKGSDTNNMTVDAT